MNRELIAVIDEIGRQKGIDKARVIGAIESALQTAAKKRFLPLLPDVHFVPYAYCYRCPFGTTPDRCNVQCAQYLDQFEDFGDEQAELRLLAR